MRRVFMIAAMMKNECSVFNEWVRHHFDEGFSHFYLVDNGSAQDCSAEIKRSVEALKKELSAALHIWVRPFQSRYLQLLVFDQLMPRFVRDELGVERTSGHSAAAARRSVAGVNASVYSITSAGGTGGRLRVGNDLGDRDELQKVSDTAGSDLWVMPIDLDEFVYSAKENTTFTGEISRMIDADARAFDAASNVTDDFDRLAALGVPTDNPVGEVLNTTAPWHLGRAAAAGLNSVVPPSYSRKRMLSQVCFPWVQFGTPGNMTLHPLEGKLRMAMTRRTKFTPENDTRVADFPHPFPIDARRHPHNGDFSKQTTIKTLYPPLPPPARAADVERGGAHRTEAVRENSKCIARHRDVAEYRVHMHFMVPHVRSRCIDGSPVDIPLSNPHTPCPRYLSEHEFSAKQPPVRSKREHEWRHLRLNHYVTQTKPWFFRVKSTRGSVSHPARDKAKNEWYFNFVNETSNGKTDYCLSAKAAWKAKDGGVRRRYFRKRLWTEYCSD